MPPLYVLTLHPHTLSLVVIFRLCPPPVIFQSPLQVIIVQSLRAHAKNMRMIIPRKVPFLPNELADNKHACIRES